MSTLVLISGEEEFLMERAAREEALLSFSSEIFEYDFPKNADKFLLESQTSSLNLNKRSFILWNVKELPIIPYDGDNIFVVVSGKKVLRDSKATRNIQFPKLKSYPDNNEVIRWILKEGDRFNIDLNRIAGALFVNCGNNLRKLSSEIEKISMSVPMGAVVTPSDARPLMCFSAELTPKEIIDSVCEGQTVKALSLYDKLQERGDETGWVIAYMQRHIIQQLKLELFINQKMSDDDIAHNLNVPIFVLRKIRLSRCDLWSKKSLKASLNTLCDLDVAHKRGEVIARFGLESEIIRLSEEARDVKRR